jgi:FAD/FMN-containing dehydrogenase
MSVRGIELVTASGELVLADATNNRELFWAARGAGPGFFGVVTRYDLALYRLPRAIFTRAVIFDTAAIDDAGDWLDEVAAAAPPQVEIIYALGANGMPASGGASANSLLIAAVAFAHSESQARTWLAPLDSHPSRAKVLAKPPAEAASFASLQVMSDADFPEGCRLAGDHCWSNASPRQILSAVRDVAIAAPSSRSFVFLSPNAIRADLNKTAADAAFSMMGSINFGAYGFWNEPRQDRENVAWVHSALRSLEPLTVGHYVGEADLSVSSQRASRCFSPTAWRKLAALKQTYDPTDVFFSYLSSS